MNPLNSVLRFRICYSDCITFQIPLEKYAGMWYCYENLRSFFCKRSRIFSRYFFTLEILSLIIWAKWWKHLIGKKEVKDQELWLRLWWKHTLPERVAKLTPFAVQLSLPERESGTGGPLQAAPPTSFQILKISLISLPLIQIKLITIHLCDWKFTQSIHILKNLSLEKPVLLNKRYSVCLSSYNL